jgi:hypothetical protein
MRHADVVEAMQRLAPGAPMGWVDITHAGAHTLDDIGVVRLERPVPHLVFVTLGLEVLSGYELTLRVRQDCDVDDWRSHVPAWPGAVLEHLAAYVRDVMPFDVGESKQLGCPIEEGSLLETVLFVRDAGLGAAFLQCAMLTPDEGAALRAWRSEEFTALLGCASPSYIALTSRASLLDLPDFRARCEEGAQRDGSSYFPIGRQVSWKTRRRFLQPAHAEVEVGRSAAREIALGLNRRLRRGEPLLIGGRANRPQTLVFATSEASGWSVDSRDATGGTLVIHVGPTLSTRIAGDFESPEGDLRWAEVGDLLIKIVPDQA